MSKHKSDSDSALKGWSEALKGWNEALTEIAKTKMVGEQSAPAGYVMVPVELAAAAVALFELNEIDGLIPDGLRDILAAAPKADVHGVVIPSTLFDQAIGWIEDRRRYGDEGTLHQVWFDLKTIQRDWRAAAPKADVQEPVASFMKTIADCRIVFADDEGKPSDVLEYIEALIENPNPTTPAGNGRADAFIWKDFTTGKQVVSIDCAPHGARPLYAAPQPSDSTVTVLPDGSAFGVMSFPLPQDHWLYAEREYEGDATEPVELGKPILTHEQSDAVVSAVRYAIRGATNCGRESDFDPDALVQNAVYALCGPYGGAAPKPPVQEPDYYAVTSPISCSLQKEYPKWAENDTSLTITKLYAAPQPSDDVAKDELMTWSEAVEKAVQLIDAEDTRLTADGYMMASDDCIDVLRESLLPAAMAGG